MEKELQKLQQNVDIIQLLLNFAKEGEIDKPPIIDNWLTELKNVKYNAHKIIDIWRINGALKSDPPSPACCNFSPCFPSCFTSVPKCDEIGNRVKELNARINLLFENGKQFSGRTLAVTGMPAILETLADDRHETSHVISPCVVGGEVEAASNELVKLLIAEKAEEKCRTFAITGMLGTGKTTLAQKVFNCPEIQAYFTLKLWVWVPQNYSEIDLLKVVIGYAKGSYGEANTKPELQTILRDSIASIQSLFLVLDDVWRADVWVDLLGLPLQTANTSARVLVTTRYEDVAMVMKVECMHDVKKLSVESSWDMLRKLLFADERQADEFKNIGLSIAGKCEGIPLLIKAIAALLARQERTRKEWLKFLKHL